MPRASAHPVATLIRGILLICIGLPYILSLIATYRPRVVPTENPTTLLRFDYVPVEFSSTDGVRLSGWWIPADGQEDARRRAQRDPSFGRKTVIVCHGLAANKASHLALVRQLVPAGYNALAFDFRAHGESTGQFTSLGDLERRDVLGAVHWLRQHQPEEAQKIVGVGHGTGAAALIAAAVDPSSDGQAIQAVAVYDTFDDFDALSREFVDDRLLAPMNWIARYVGMPLASAHAGTNLADFRPAELVHDLWPRPIMVIHAVRDDAIDLDHGRSLFDSAFFPKRSLWMPWDDQHRVILNEDAASEVYEFFETARPLPGV
jgi:pimeloyl-ACP methyl ester carboxylesterase